MNNGQITIQEYDNQYQQQVIDLILNIQQNEFHVPVTLQDQPDLLNVAQVYQLGGGNFWIAFSDKQVIGTVSLIYFEHNKVALRKMFVHKDFRGKEKGIGLLLLKRAIDWCKEKNFEDIYLGTVEILAAARRFYLKNGFESITKENLPPNFPLMPVDTLFYHKKIGNQGDSGQSMMSQERRQR